jgi:hypothetical protein
MLYAFFWVTPWRLNFIFGRFGTLFHLRRLVGMKMEQSVPKRRRIKFRRRRITQNKAYNMCELISVYLRAFLCWPNYLSSVYCVYNQFYMVR